NLEIAKAGIEGNYGVQIGKHILERDHTLDGKIIAYTSAASEARMCGCVKPVVINSGSGNQGLSTSLPVIIYGLENNYPKEEIYRALVFANLLTIKQKYRLGTLSAFCGVTSSCGAAGAALTYLCKGTKEQIKMTLNNHLAIIPGMICDGAKDSCSGKIFAALSSSLMSFHLAMANKSFQAGQGILKDTIDKTIDVVSCIGSEGMISTDDEIMKVLLD
ncbi:MAG: L-serine ammonia-lyase, iron-sulfur-dependent, subunit alpha, partial [Bacilli bacterium]